MNLYFLFIYSVANLKYMLKLRFPEDKLRLIKIIIIFTDKAKRNLKEEEEEL